MGRKIMSAFVPSKDLPLNKLGRNGLRVTPVASVPSDGAAIHLETRKLNEEHLKEVSALYQDIFEVLQ